MLTTVNAEYTDTRAEDLAWCVGKEPLPALGVLNLDPAGSAVQLRLLGTSHQVLVRSPRGDFSETVACLPGHPASLPLGASKQIGGWNYEFSARVEKLPADAFAGRAEELLDLVADHPNVLAGLFPGEPLAFTAMLMRTGDGQLNWRTWHAYPQQQSLVETRSRVTARRWPRG